MNFRANLASIITGLGIVAAAYSANASCVAHAVVLPTNDGKICFSREVDYKAYRDDFLATYSNQLQNAANDQIGLVGDWAASKEFFLMLNEETRRGRFAPQSLISPTTARQTLLNLNLTYNGNPTIRMRSIADTIN